MFDKARQNDFFLFSPLVIKSIIKKQTHCDIPTQQTAQRILSSILNLVFLVDDSSSLPLPLRHPTLIQKYSSGAQFLSQLKDIDSFDYQVDNNTKVDLRNYQKEGIKWLAFLTKYNFNGALCDDMGLGKTIQTLTVLQNEIQKCILKGKPIKKSLIICP